jgi:hypothetical protein
VFNRLLATDFNVRREGAAAAECELPSAGCMDRDAGPSSAPAPSIGPETVSFAGTECPAWAQPVNASLCESNATLAGSVQPNDTSSSESVSCAEPPPAASTGREPISGQKPEVKRSCAEGTGLRRCRDPFVVLLAPLRSDRILIL